MNRSPIARATSNFNVVTLPITVATSNFNVVTLPIAVATSNFSVVTLPIAVATSNFDVVTLPIAVATSNFDVATLPIAVATSNFCVASPPSAITFRPAMNLPDTHALSPEQYDDLLANQDWASLTKRLTQFAYRKIHKRSWEEAEDIAQTAIRRAFDPKCQRWNPKAQPNVFWFLGNVAQGVIANRRRKLKTGRVETPHDHQGLDELAESADAIDATDEVLARRHRAALIVRELARQVAAERACALVLAAFQAEIDDPREQAASTGLAMQAVYNARSKLRALVTQIAQTFDQGTLQ